MKSSQMWHCTWKKKSFRIRHYFCDTLNSSRCIRRNDLDAIRTFSLFNWFLNTLDFSHSQFKNISAHICIWDNNNDHVHEKIYIKITESSTLKMLLTHGDFMLIKDHWQNELSLLSRDVLNDQVFNICFKVELLFALKIKTAKLQFVQIFRCIYLILICMKNLFVRKFELTSVCWCSNPPVWSSSSSDFCARELIETPMPRTSFGTLSELSESTSEASKTLVIFTWSF